MKNKSLSHGRIKQKLKTREEILAAANLLMHGGKKITLDDVAREAGISRATIYRYYSNIDLLATEAALDIYHITPEKLFEQIESLPLADGIIYIQKHYNRMAVDHEMVFRRYLSAVLSESITSKEKLRGARRVASLTKVMEPYKKKVDKETMKKMINLFSVLMGIDALLVCKDVCDLDNKEAEETLKWGVEMILKSINIKEG